jgi:hypothetical protein
MPTPAQAAPLVAKSSDKITSIAIGVSSVATTIVVGLVSYNGVRHISNKLERRREANRSDEIRAVVAPALSEVAKRGTQCTPTVPAVAVKNTAGGVAASAGAAVTINRWSVNFCDDVGADAVECSYQCRWSWRCKRGWCFSAGCGSWSSASNRRLCLLESP